MKILKIMEKLPERLVETVLCLDLSGRVPYGVKVEVDKVMIKVDKMDFSPKKWTVKCCPNWWALCKENTASSQEKSDPSQENPSPSQKKPAADSK